MKKAFRKSLFYCLLFMAFGSHAQFYSYQGISGLMLHLDAAYGFNDNGSAPATWKDISGSGNDMVCNLVNEPSYVSMISGTPFSGVYFNSAGSGNFMYNQSLNSTFSTTEATLFVVLYPTSNTYSSGIAQTLLSISQNGVFNNEFGLMLNYGLHHNCISDYEEQHKDNCFGSLSSSNLPGNKPALFVTALGTNASDIYYAINNDAASPSTPFVVGAPGVFATSNRRIYLGTRMRAAQCNASLGSVGDVLDGIVLEVLAYNRKLSSSEIAEVSNYLRCKYDITYNYASGCNTAVSCGNECLRFADLKYISTGPDQTGNNCTFDAIVTAYPKNNYDLYAYEWRFPAYTSFVVGPPAPNTDIQHFTLSGSSSYSYANSVTIHTVKQTGYAWNVDSSGPCCDWLAWATVGCENGTGLGSQKNGIETDTTFVHVSRSANGIRIYPNPTNGVFFVETNIDKAYFVLIVDYLGREVKKVNMKSGKAIIDLNSNISGLYSIRILSAENKVLQLSKVSYIK